MTQPKHPLAARVANLEPSGIRKVFEIANAHPEYINLSIGEPDFDMPMFLKEEGIKAILAGYNRYTPTRGIPQLRQVVADQLTADGIRFGDLFITAGATGALLLTIQALVDQGDEVIVPDPYFVAYRNIVYMAGGKPVSVDTYPDFQLRADVIAPLITDRTRALIINSPNNPTGMIYHRAELEKIVALADKHGFYIISDEVYTPFIYDGAFTSLGHLTDDAIVVNSFSKSAAMTGWRLGYVSGPAAVIDKMAMLQQFAYASTNSVAQYTALRAFEVDYSEQRRNYQRKRDICFEMLSQKYAVLKPEGSFYIFPAAPDGNGSAFFERAREAGVLIIPGKDFSRRDTHFRISFAVSDEVLLRGMEILLSLG
jgi:aspartate aminotransferase/aminotransferase